MKTIKIGRSSECDIVLTYDKISRVHAILSFNGDQYIYQDISKNGSNIGGRMFYNGKLIIAPGTTVLLANKIPLPWEQVYAMLSPQGRSVNTSGTVIEEGQPFVDRRNYSDSPQNINHHPQTYRRDELGVGWGILAFLIPLAGWIMYFSWKDETPNRAKWAGVIGLISFGIGFLALL